MACKSEEQGMGTIVQLLEYSKSTEQEVQYLENMKTNLTPQQAETDISEFPLEEDSLEKEWLQFAADNLDDDNPFPRKYLGDIIKNQPDRDKFVYYLFDRRFGWSESKNDSTRRWKPSHVGNSTEEEMRLKTMLNDLLEDYIKWLLCQPVSDALLMSIQYTITQASNKPVVRNQTVIHMMQWLKINMETTPSQHYNLIKKVILQGLTDVWSAIRNACVTRLSSVIQYFTIAQLHNFFDDLVQICQSSDSGWQAKEGAVMGINSVVRRFQWIGLVPDDLPVVTETSGSTKPEYFLRFGRQELQRMPEFISNQMRAVMFPLLAHPQLSIRENAIKAFSAYLARCDFKEALSSFNDVVKQLCRDVEVDDVTDELNLPDMAVQQSKFTFMDAYAAEGLLGVCVFLIKHIPPGFLLPNWPLYLSTFSLYLMHPASTVRQATSTIFKFLVAKDSNNPTMLKLVLQGLCTQWQVSMELLNHQHGLPPPLLSRQTADSSSKADARAGGRRPSFKAGSRRISVTHLTRLERVDRNPSETWEWREGRLLAYELIMQFLIKNHWLYTFGAPSVHDQGQMAAQVSAPPGSSVDESTFSRDNLKRHKEVTKTSSYGGATLHHAMSVTSPNPPKSSTPTPGERHSGGQFVLPPISEEEMAQARKTSLTNPAVIQELLDSHNFSEGDVMSYRRMHGRKRFSISTCSLIHELHVPRLPLHSRTMTQAGSGLLDPSSGRTFQRLPTVTGYTSPSLRTLVRHYSYYTQASMPYGPEGTPFIGKAASLLMYTLALDLQQTKGAVSGSNLALEDSGSRPLSPKPDAEILRSCLSPSPLRSDEDTSYKEPKWLSTLELDSFSALLQKLLYQTIESLADNRWELRRMGQQLLPCLVEVMRWYDMRVLEELWNVHLTPGATTLLCYGACLALKYSLSHAAHLQPMLQHPPASWQDSETCRQAVLRITEPIAQRLPQWIMVVQTILQRPYYDKLSVVAMETIMLAHSHFSLNVEQKKIHLQTLVSILLTVFSKAHPDLKLTAELSPPRLMEKVFQTPLDGFLSCCSRSDGTVEQAAQQVEQHILSETKGILGVFLGSASVTNTASLLPILVYYCGLYVEDDDMCKSLVDSATVLSGRCSDYIETEQADREQLVYKYSLLAMREAASLITHKTVDLMMLRQVLDLYWPLYKSCQDSRQLQFLLQAICARLNNVDEFRPITPLISDNHNGDLETNLAMLSNDIRPPLVPHLDSEESDQSDQDDPDVVVQDSLLPESHSLNISSNSGSVPSGRHSAHSTGSYDGHMVSAASGAESEAESDWDSWSDDEAEDQTAVTQMFGEFLSKMGTSCKPETESVSQLQLEIVRLPEKDKRLIQTVLHSH